MPRNEADRKYIKKTTAERQKFYKKVGKLCAFCGSEKILSCHRKDGKSHMRIANLTLRQIQKEDPKDYTRLCFKCHFGVHWVMKYLHLMWDELEEFIE